jgi:hypothetical protein
MDTETHNRIIDQAFGPTAESLVPSAPASLFRLAAQDVMIFKKSSSEADGIFNGGQRRDASFKHAMRGWGQSTAEAEAKFKAWVSYCLNLASDLQRGGSHAAALHRLGLGMHALADKESQAHFGFQSWGGDGPLNVPGALLHHNLESGVGKSHYQIKCAAINLQTYYYEFAKKAGEVSP